jgi:hypothetical protein
MYSIVPVLIRCGVPVAGTRDGWPLDGSAELLTDEPTTAAIAMATTATRRDLVTGRPERTGNTYAFKEKRTLSHVRVLTVRASQCAL